MVTLYQFQKAIKKFLGLKNDMTITDRINNHSNLFAWSYFNFTIVKLNNYVITSLILFIIKILIYYKIY
jgi:hypothetical protein